MSNKQSSSSLTPAQITSLHLYDLTHTTPTSPLNKLYSIRFESHLTQKSINLPPILSHKFCPACGMIRIPGINVSIRIIYKKKGRRLRYRCLRCRGIEYDDSIIQGSTEKPTETVVEEVKEEFKAEWSVEKNSNRVSPEVAGAGNKKSKDRAKKRSKQLNLSNLLELKKKQKLQESKLNSLDLMEFLK